jgi:hypothetical protein
LIPVHSECVDQTILGKCCYLGFERTYIMLRIYLKTQDAFITMILVSNHFPRDKKKELAPNYAAYYPFGVDIYLSSQKLNHISRYVQLPDVHLSSKLLPLLVVNVQVSKNVLASIHLFEEHTQFVRSLHLDVLPLFPKYCHR